MNIRLFILVLTVAITSFEVSAQHPSFDPLLDNNATVLPSVKQETWQSSYMWYPGQLAAFLQQQLKAQSAARCVHVGYPGNFFAPVFHAYFKTHIRLKNATPIKWVGTGKTTLFVDRREIQGDSTLLPAGIHSLSFRVETQKGLPCLLIQGNRELENYRKWFVSLDDSHWVMPESDARYDNPQLPPDAFPEATVQLSPVHILPLRNTEVDSLHTVRIGKRGMAMVDFFHLETGVLSFRAKGRGTVTVRVGETPEEALNQDEKLFEQYAVPPFTLSGSESEIILPERALRYAVLECDGEAEIHAIRFDARVWPVEFLMQFQSDDPYINKMFNMSRATLHASMHSFYLDGLKRDFLPWAMDAIVSSFAGNYLFGDRQVAKNGISVSLLPLDPQRSDLGVTDYPLHALFGLKQYYKRYGEKEILSQYKERITQLMNLYRSLTDANGFFSGKMGSAGYIPGWSTQNGPASRGIASYPQIMLYGCYCIAAEFSEIWHEKQQAEAYRQQAETLKKNIFRYFWDKERKAFINGTDNQGKPDRRISHHAQYWAILTGIFPKEYYDNLFENILPNLPYYYDDISYEKGYEMLAYTKAGRIKEQWDFLYRTFGDWMDQGYSRFPENLSPRKDRIQQLSFYRRPYGLSLCHGANGVPIVVGILNGLLGFNQSDNKLNEYTIRPQMLHLKKINARIPIKEGFITLQLNAEGKNEIEIPAGCTVNVINGSGASQKFTQKGLYWF